MAVSATATTMSMHTCALTPQPCSMRRRVFTGCRSRLVIVCGASGTGHQATVVFTVQRADVVHGVRPSDFHDPAFAAALRAAARAGVRLRAVRIECGKFGSKVLHEIPVDVSPYDVAPIAAEWERNRPVLSPPRTRGPQTCLASCDDVWS